MSANAADTNCCFALTALKNIAKIIHSLEIREAQMPWWLSPHYMLLTILGFAILFIFIAQ